MFAEGDGPARFNPAIRLNRDVRRGGTGTPITASAGSLARAEPEVIAIGLNRQETVRQNGNSRLTP